jgi:hypothetical protein
MQAKKQAFKSPPCVLIKEGVAAMSSASVDDTHVRPVILETFATLLRIWESNLLRPIEEKLSCNEGIFLRSIVDVIGS